MCALYWTASARQQGPQKLPHPAGKDPAGLPVWIPCTAVPGEADERARIVINPFTEAFAAPPDLFNGIADLPSALEGDTGEKSTKQ